MSRLLPQRLTAVRIPRGRSVAVRVLGLAALAIWLVALRPAALGGPVTYVVVSGESMRPTLEHGDLVVARAQPVYDVGDVVVFTTPEGPLVIHRIIGGDAAGGFRLQGDNKPEPDHWTPRAEEILGEAWLHVPAGGRLLGLAGGPLPLGLLAALATFRALSSPRPASRTRPAAVRLRPAADIAATVLHVTPLPAPRLCLPAAPPLRLPVAPPLRLPAAPPLRLPAARLAAVPAPPPLVPPAPLDLPAPPAPVGSHAEAAALPAPPARHLRLVRGTAA